MSLSKTIAHVAWLVLSLSLCIDGAHGAAGADGKSLHENILDSLSDGTGKSARGSNFLRTWREGRTPQVELPELFQLVDSVLRERDPEMRHRAVEQAIQHYPPEVQDAVRLTYLRTFGVLPQQEGAGDGAPPAAAEEVTGRRAGIVELLCSFGFA